MKLIVDLEAWVCPMCNGKGSLPDLEIDGSKHRCRSCAPIVAARPAILTALRAAEALPELLRKMAFGSSPGYELACRDIAVIIEHRVLAALGEGPQTSSDTCPRKGCTHLPDGGPVAKDGVYRGARFCLCHQFETGPYAKKGEGPREGKSE